jgi:4-hydroxythreonine-4-phosphate dehydrogenase
MPQRAAGNVRLALVPGEPAGVGPELCVRLAQQPRDYELTVFADPRTLRAAADALALPLTLVPAGQPGRKPSELAIREIANTALPVFGVPDPRNARAVIGALHEAAAGCLRGDFDGLVTGPVHKATINEGGIAYTGTTELLATQAGCDVVMMLANDIVRVALATTHLPLREVADAITPEVVERTLRITHAALRSDFGLADPIIAVLGLNPHAGEAGHLGSEEIKIIEPVLASLRNEGMQIVGPLPADTAFLPAKLRGFDAVVAMYHDQGLPVLKYASFGRGVNVTLGLPFVRTSVDHGTALDIAGTGRADPSSLVAAIRLADEIARNRAR